MLARWTRMGAYIQEFKSTRAPGEWTLAMQPAARSSVSTSSVVVLVEFGFRPGLADKVIVPVVGTPHACSWSPCGHRCCEPTSTGGLAPIALNVVCPIPMCSTRPPGPKPPDQNAAPCGVAFEFGQRTHGNAADASVHGARDGRLRAHPHPRRSSRPRVDAARPPAGFYLSSRSTD
jgi:hypothetical protein